MNNELTDAMVYTNAAAKLFPETLVRWGKLSGKELTLLGAVYNIRRKLYERIPIIGDYFFRKRFVKILKEKSNSIKVTVCDIGTTPPPKRMTYEEANAAYGWNLKPPPDTEMLIIPIDEDDQP